MQWLIDNSFLIIVVLAMVGMHVFGHGHGKHDRDKPRDEHSDEHSDDPHDRRD